MSSSYTDQDYAFFHHINRISSGFSLLGSLWMTYFCLRTSSPRSVSLNIILAIAISDLAYSISNIMSEFERNTTIADAYCVVEGIMRQSSVVSSIYWTMCTAILCYKSSKYISSFSQNAFFRNALIVNLVIIFLTILIPQFTDKIGFVKGPLMCWLNYTNKVTSFWGQFAVRFLFEYFIVILALTASIFGYLKAIKNFNSLPQYLIDHINVKVYKLLWYPVVLFIIFLPSMLDNLWVNISGAPAAVSVKAFHLGVTHAIGFINALVYGIQRKSYRNHSADRDRDGSFVMSEGSDVKKHLLQAESDF